jgi:hypothetical protein
MGESLAETFSDEKRGDYVLAVAKGRNAENGSSFVPQLRDYGATGMLKAGRRFFRLQMHQRRG